MSVSVPFIIRDGTTADVAPALALDHSYETDFVWQVQFERDDPTFLQMTLRLERLPRTLTAVYPASEARIRSVMVPQHCFLIAAERDTGDVLGYLGLMTLPAHRLAAVVDLVVDRPARRHKIGSRLLNVARRWAREHDCERLWLELQTRNYPAIAFSQTYGLTFCGYNERYFDQQDLAVFFGQTLR